MNKADKARQAQYNRQRHRRRVNQPWVLKEKEQDPVVFSLPKEGGGPFSMAREFYPPGLARRYMPRPISALPPKMKIDPRTHTIGRLYGIDYHYWRDWCGHFSIWQYRYFLIRGKPLNLRAQFNDIDSLKYDRWQYSPAWEYTKFRPSRVVRDMKTDDAKILPAAYDCGIDITGPVPHVRILKVTTYKPYMAERPVATPLDIDLKTGKFKRFYMNKILRRLFSYKPMANHEFEKWYNIWFERIRYYCKRAYSTQGRWLSLDILGGHLFRYGMDNSKDADKKRVWGFAAADSESVAIEHIWRNVDGYRTWPEYKAILGTLFHEICDGIQKRARKQRLFFLGITDIEIDGKLTGGQNFDTYKIEQVRKGSNTWPGTHKSQFGTADGGASDDGWPGAISGALGRTIKVKGLGWGYSTR